MHSSISLRVRRIAILLVVLAGVFCIPTAKISAQCGGYGQKSDVTSLGKEFLLCFMKNIDGEDQDPQTRYQDIYLAAASDSATVTITCKAFPGWSKVIKLQAREATTYRLSNDPVIGYPMHDAIIETCEIKTQTVFLVTSTSAIACYGMNNKIYTADAFLALPRNVAGTEYRVMSYYNSTQLVGMEEPSEFCVAAFDDNTTVTITPSATTCNNDSGVTQTFVLNAGEGVQIQASTTSKPLLDLTGSSVSSDKLVVVYGGHQRTEAPIGFSFNDQGVETTTRDHLCEQIPPLSTWGYSFLTKNFGRADGDVLRVLANVGNTIVKINGVIWGTPLRADEFRDTIIQLSNFAVDNVVAVESDNTHLILVGMIAHTAPNSTGTGDPFLAIVPPLDQTYTDFTYFLTTDTANNYYPTQQYLIVAAEQGSIGNIIIDGGTPFQLIPPKLAYTMYPKPLFGGQYGAMTLNQKGGIHHITSASPTGFTILAYGWGNKISYGYTAGALLKPTKPIAYIPSPPRGVAPGPGGTAPILPPPSITIRNILTERVYFDSVKFIYSQNTKNIPVRLKKDIALDIGTIEMAEEKTLELATAQPITEPIIGNIRIWSHSRLWTDMYPVDFPFTISPQQEAGVNSVLQTALLLENYPNPVSGRTTVHFRIPSRANISLKIYDALGRVVRTLKQGIVNSEDQQIQVNTKGMTPGEYTLELIAPDLGINEHRKMIVIE